MATRLAVNKQKIAVLEKLRSNCRSGRLAVGEPVPPLRELAEEFGISRNTVSQVLQELVDEGLFYTVPRVGTFVGQPPRLAEDVYLLLAPDHIGITRKINLQMTQQGFEERIAERGSLSVTMPLSRALQLREDGQLPPVAGLFDLAYHSTDARTWGQDRSTPRVGFSGRVEDPEYSDSVSYDDMDGGRQATRHLLRMGHRKIAFLALHHPQDDGHEELVWSRDREAGWRAAMTQAGLSYESLSFHPRQSKVRSHEEQMAAGRELAAMLLKREEITAVVAANDFVALGLMEATLSCNVRSRRDWPAVVGFDNLPHSDGCILSSLRLPAEELGRSAADLLWERRHGLSSGPPRHRNVPMRLISRLTSSHQWSRSELDTTRSELDITERSDAERMWTSLTA